VLLHSTYRRFSVTLHFKTGRTAPGPVAVSAHVRQGILTVHLTWDALSVRRNIKARLPKTNRHPVAASFDRVFRSSEIFLDLGLFGGAACVPDGPKSKAGMHLLLRARVE
jgi:hypothetical protein